MQSMHWIRTLAGLGIVVFFLSACGGGTGPQPDLDEVLNRTIHALKRYEAYMEEKGVSQASEENMQQLALFLSGTLNVDPKFYPAPIGVTLLADGSFEGYKDSNGDNSKGIGESRIFTLEIDSENNRIICTDYTGQARSSGLGLGLLGGMLIGNLLNRQQSSGIRPGSFNNRKISSREEYRNSFNNSTRSSGSSARSGARSGGPSRGK